MQRSDIVNVIIGVVVAALMSIAGLMLNRVSTTKEELRVSQEKSTERQKQLESEIEKNSSLMEERRLLITKYEKRIAALDSAGKAILDAQGNPVFNTESGETSLAEQLHELKTQYSVVLAEKDTSLDLMRRELEQVKSKVSSPGLRPIVVSYDYTWPDFGRMGAGRHAGGLGYNFMLGPWQVTALGAVVLPEPGKEMIMQNFGGRAQVLLTP